MRGELSEVACLQWSISLFISYVDAQEGLLSLGMKVSWLADHSVFVFKDLLMTMLSLLARKLLFCSAFANGFSVNKRRGVPASILAVGIMFVLTSA